MGRVLGSKADVKEDWILLSLCYGKSIKTKLMFVQCDLVNAFNVTEGYN